jgi:hypothetical protein
MKTKWLIGTALCAAVSLPAFSQIGFYIGTTPPPLRYEVRPAPPGPDFVWVNGYWAWRDGRYVWIPGHWDRPPYAGAYWVHPHYDRYERGWVYRDGYWSHERHEEHEDWDHDHDHH